MRVLHAFKDYYPPTNGGVEKHIHQVVHGISGLDLSVLTSARSRKLVIEADDGVEVIRAPEYARPVSTPVTPSWHRYLRDPRFDLVHFHMPNPFGEMASLASRSRVPYVVTFHAEIVGRRLILPAFAPFQQAFLAKAKRIVVGSEKLLQTSPTLAGHRSKTVVIPFGIQVKTWTDRPARADSLRADYGTPLVVFLGRLSYYKGLEVLLEAMETVDATCLIVGDGPKRMELEIRAKAPGLAGKVVFCGEVADEDRAVFYHAADIFVLPATSRAEAFGIAMLEAMACGTPAISTELGTGTSWVNQHDVTGLVVEPRSSLALAKALNEVLRDDARRSEMGEAAARRARDQFSLAQMLRSLESLYLSISA